MISPALRRLALTLLLALPVLVSAQQVQQTEPYRAGPGIQFPTPVRSVQPKYTPEALQAKVKGVVELEVVVSPTGTVGDVRVTKSLDTKYGLDQQAIEAAKQWVFRPGMKDGRRMRCSFTRTLRRRLRMLLRSGTTLA